MGSGTKRPRAVGEVVLVFAKLIETIRLRRASTARRTPMAMVNAGRARQPDDSESKERKSTLLLGRSSL